MGVRKYGFDNTRRLIESRRISDDDMIMRLQYIGEAICNHARTVTKGHASGGYDDQTGNLRSSIGYRIFKDGRALNDGGFSTVTGAEGVGSEGKSAASRALREYSKSVPRKGWTLLVVAGMEYAKYVEDKGYNVLHLSKIELDKEIEQLKKRLKL